MCYWQLQERHAATSGAAPVSPDEGFEQFLCREVGRTLSGGSVTSEHRATFDVGPGAAMHSFAEEALHAILTMANQSEASAPHISRRASNGVCARTPRIELRFHTKKGLEAFEWGLVVQP